MTFLLIRSVDILLVSIWVGICASVPEVVWQGAKLLLGHGGLDEFLISSLLVGMMLAFFVEPLMERLKARSWIAHHEPQGRAFVRILIAVVFGMVTVCIHQCIDTLLHHKVVTPLTETTGLREAIRIAVQWSFIPIVFTTIWFVGLNARRSGNLLVGLACVPVLGVTTWVFQWHVSNALSSTAVAALTSLIVINRIGLKRDLYETSHHQLWLSLTAGLCFAGCTVVLLLINTYVVTIDYDGLDYGEDARFYLGWVLGLSFLPKPHPAAKARDADPAPSG